MAADLVLLGLATLLAPVFAEYAKIRGLAERQFNFVAAAGLFFLLAASFGVSVLENVTASVYGVWLFEFLGWLFLLVGALWAVFSGLMK